MQMKFIVIISFIKLYFYISLNVNCTLKFEDVKYYNETYKIY